MGYLKCLTNIGFELSTVKFYIVHNMFSLSLATENFMIFLKEYFTSYIYLFPTNQTLNAWLLLLSSVELQLGPDEEALATSLLSRRVAISYIIYACFHTLWLNMCL